MLDLNQNLHFKARFQVTSKDHDEDLLWKLVLAIKYWMCNKWKRNNEVITDDLEKWTEFKYGTYFYSENEMVELQSVLYQKNENESSWACKIIENWPSHQGCAPRQWTTEIGYQALSEDSADVSIVIYWQDRPGFIGPLEAPPSGSTPNIIRILCLDKSLSCTVEGYPLRLKARRLRPGDFSEFWKVISDEKREIPVIYISPRSKGHGNYIGNNLLEPDKLQEILAANALVYYANEIDFSREMTKIIPQPDLGCYSGTVRIYRSYPNVSDETDKFRHCCIGVRELLENGQGCIDMLGRALVQDVHFYEKMFRTEDCKKLNSQKREKEALEERKKQIQDEAEETVLEDLEKLEKEKNQAENDNLELKVDNDDLRAKLFQANARADSLAGEARLSRERNTALEKIRNTEAYPQTALEITQYFKTVYSDRIVFTERAIKSLNSCTTAVDLLWTAYYQMCTILWELYQNDEITRPDYEFSQRSSNFTMSRGEGANTRHDSRLMEKYEVTYQGKKYNIETHIKTNANLESKSRFLRIYFAYDQEMRKIIIGSVGNHLENATTKKVR